MHFEDQRFMTSLGDWDFVDEIFAFLERSVCDKGSLIAAQTALEQDSFDANEFSITISTLFKTPTEAPAAADWQTASKTKLKLKPVRQNFTQFRFIFVMNLLKKWF